MGSGVALPCQYGQPTEARLICDACFRAMFQLALWPVGGAARAVIGCESGILIVSRDSVYCWD